MHLAPMTNTTRRTVAPPQESGVQPPEAVAGRVKTVAIDGGLHARLKARAAREGKMLQVLVESKLRELLEDEAEVKA